MPIGTRSRPAARRHGRGAVHRRDPLLQLEPASSASQALELGLYLGIGGILTFRRSDAAARDRARAAARAAAARDRCALSRARAVSRQAQRARLRRACRGHAGRGQRAAASPRSSARPPTTSSACSPRRSGPPAARMRVTVLGCGTSSGVPVIGCRCAVCTSGEPRNRRRRCAILIEQGATRVLVDTPPDLRCQCLDAGVDRLDAILYTHAHADHVNGIDDVRALNFLMDRPIDAYGDAAVLARIRERFGYAFQPPEPDLGWWRPALEADRDRGPVRGRRARDPAVRAAPRPAARAGASGSAASPIRPTSTACPRRRSRRSPGVEVWLVDCLRERPASDPCPSRADAGLDRRDQAAPRGPDPHEPRARLLGPARAGCRRASSRPTTAWCSRSARTERSGRYGRRIHART